MTASAAGKPTAPSAALSAVEVSVRYGGLIALDRVSLAVPAHGVAGLIGPNGAGKSTLFGVLTGFVRPTGGQVHFGDLDISRLSPNRRVRLGIARTFQHPSLYMSLTVEQHLILAYRMRHARDRLWKDLVLGTAFRASPADEKELTGRLITELGLSRVARRPISGLPLGVGRVVEVGRALVGRPRALLLDEPSAGLDPAETENLAEVVRTVAAPSTGVLLVEHDLDFVMGLAETISVLDFGRLIAAGPPDEIRRDLRVRQAYLGDAVDGASDRPATADLPHGPGRSNGPVAEAGSSREERHDDGPAA